MTRRRGFGGKLQQTSLQRRSRSARLRWAERADSRTSVRLRRFRDANDDGSCRVLDLDTTSSFDDHVVEMSVQPLSAERSDNRARRGRLREPEIELAARDEGVATYLQSPGELPAQLERQLSPDLCICPDYVQVPARFVVQSATAHVKVALAESGRR